MNNLNKTKVELVKELQELQKKYAALKESYEKDIIERKKTEEKLLIINKAVESASDAIGISDAKGHHFYQNKALSDLFEYTTAEELEAAGGGATVVKDPEVSKAMFGNIMSGESWSGELEMVTKSGRVFPAYERADAIKDNDGNIIGLIGIITDITQRKRTEDALRESNDMYQAIFESTGAVTLIVDEDTTILMANNECYSITGYTPSELIGQKWTHYVAPESLQKMLMNQQLRRQNPDLVPKKYEVKMVNKKGELCHAMVDIGMIPNTKQGVVSILDITESKKAEEALQKSEEKYRTLTENIGEGVGFINEEEIFVYANPSAEKIFGVGEGGLMGLCINDFLVGENIELVKNETQQRRQGKSSVFEHEIVLKDGSKKDILATATPSFDDKNFVGTFAIFRDITDRKKTERALRESEAIHRNLVERMPDGVYKSTHDGKFVDVNPAMIKMLGYDSKEELLAIDIKKQLYFELADRESLELQDELEEMGVYPLKKKDGSAIWVEDHGWYNTDENGNILFHEGILRDITDRKKTEDALIENEERYRVFINSTKDMVFLKDHKLNYLLVNDSLAQFFRAEKKKIIGKADYELMPEEAAKSCHATDEQALMSDLVIISEEHVGNNIYETNKFKVPFRNGKYGVGGYIRDITERKASEAHLNNQTKELKELNSTKDKFFSIIAHDLRSPFNSLLGFTELLEKELPTMTRDQIQQIVVTMRKSATNLYALLENLLEWSRLQRGLITFNPEPIILMPKIIADIALLMDSANKKEIEINFDIPEDLKVYADENMLGGILRNLTSNAVKFTPKGGKVFISAKSLDNAVECSVSDTGIGMNQEMKENLFKIDVNTSRKGTEKETSTGLGLIICREFIDKHGGKLWVESEQGKGSTFHFTLPSNMV